MIVQTQGNDVLSDILATVRTKTRCSISLKAGGEWGVSFPMPSHLKFNAVRNGRCWLRLEGREPIQLVEGDCVVMAGTPFVLSSNPDGATISARDVFASDAIAATIGNGDDFAILGGSVEVDGVDGVLLTEALPPVLTIQGARAASIAWLLAELDREWNSVEPGARLVSNDLLRLIFVQVLRIHLSSEENHTKGWLSGLADAGVARALKAIHGDPTKGWTVESLAKEAGQSRSAFAARFKVLLGQAPVEYLTKWRMRLAAAMLRNTRSPIRAVASNVGYSSDSAMSSAFRRVYHMSPAKYRSVNRA
ncbi:AraC family transcriptional regulator (plasmid) [Agrobacterium salinitolerans]|uniref:AraC family transcriptional regulator n=1 Tax=Agrobacterium salinitolerans TaxID=1183413 RepID=UPI001C249109|nr:AraC family transcriptional regulator [Agrobacterium salinitolerans]QXC53039.1 AraC family transcriptional regulator [Agrobacterium salinitolerans]